MNNNNMNHNSIHKTKRECLYSWHLSLRVDRPVENCTMQPHAYLYGRKLLDNPHQHYHHHNHSNVTHNERDGDYFDNNHHLHRHHKSMSSSSSLPSVQHNNNPPNHHHHHHDTHSNTTFSSSSSLSPQPPYHTSTLSSSTTLLSYDDKNNNHTHKEPPPQHEFSYRWLRGPLHKPQETVMDEASLLCAYEACPRRRQQQQQQQVRNQRSSNQKNQMNQNQKNQKNDNNCFSPHAWTQFALQRDRGGSTENHGSSSSLSSSSSSCIQCVSTQSSLYKSIFCNTECFILAWKTQYTILPKHNHNTNSSVLPQLNGTRGSGGDGHRTPNRSRSPSRIRSGNITEQLDPHPVEVFDDDALSLRSNGSKSSFYDDLKYNHSSSHPGTPKGFVSGDNDNNDNELGGDWIEVSRDPVYVPGPDDVGHTFQVEATAYAVASGEPLMLRIVQTDVCLSRAPDPAKRSFITHTHTGTTSTTATASKGGSGPRFRIASYNILAEIYATQQQYPYCDFWALHWEYRFHNVMREVRAASPEVLCLQEMQADHYERHVYTRLCEAGYDGVFTPKTRPSMGLAGKMDGCAVFWKRSMFRLVESYSIEFNVLAQRYAAVNHRPPRGGLLRSSSSNSSNEAEYAACLNRLSKDNVAQLVVLEFIRPTVVHKHRIGGRISEMMMNHHQQVCIANTHLYSHKDFPDVKLWQAWQLLLELESFMMSRGSNLPLVLCGDWNSTPDTAVYELLSRQCVHPDHPDVNMVATAATTCGGEVVDSNIPKSSILPDAQTITHSFQLGSVYQSVLGTEPWTTHYTLNFKGVLDYIWYSVPHIMPLSVAQIPDKAQLTQNGVALPNSEYSSDHIMLIADLQILTSSSSSSNK